MQSIGAEYTVLVEQSGSGHHGRFGRNTRDSFGIRARNIFSNFTFAPPAFQLLKGPLNQHNAQ
jgi:hypothetical protein